MHIHRIQDGFYTIIAQTSNGKLDRKTD